MIRNFFKIAFRNLWKNKLFSVIKIAGLGIALATCLLVGLFLHHELSYDAFHDNADRIVRTTMEYRFNGEVRQTQTTGNKVGPTFLQDFPEVVDAVRVISYDRVVRFEDQLFEESSVYFADPSFFSIFTFSLLQGNAARVLQGPDEVVLTASMAEKYFGKENPMGKRLRIGGGEYLVQGVMADPPATSQLKPNFVASFASLRDAQPERATWWNANYATYLLLTDPGVIQGLQQKIPAYMRTKEGEHGAAGDDYLNYHLEPLKEVYLRSPVEGNFEPNGNIQYMFILGFAALIVLLIACITYVNLTTATGSERAKEIGISKAIGARRIQLFGQHIGESVIATGFAFVFAALLALVALPFFSQILQRPLSWGPIWSPEALVVAGMFGLLISFLSGVYPAVILSSYQPAQVLKGTKVSSKSGSWLRKSLIVAQFSISVFLLICTGILFYQLQFIQNKTLGYEKDQVLVLPADAAIVDAMDAIKTELLQNSNIRAVSLAYETPVDINGGYSISQSLSGENHKPVTALPADEDFLEATGIELVAGHTFQRRDIDALRRIEQGADSTTIQPILINESQAASFGWTPEEAINQFVNFNGNEVRIEGVMKDFHFASLHVPIENLVVFPSDYGRQVLVRTGMQEVSETLNFLGARWETLAPHRPFTYHFMSDEVDRMYLSETQIATLVSALAGLALFMTGIGLFGLTAITAQQRTKEIGIRKVLGASVMGIIGMLSRDLIRMMGLAFVVAAPFGFFLMQGWLEGFAYRTGMPWGVFVGAGLLAFTIAFLTVCSQSLKPARSNPVDALRYE